jgi:hypothetical protein
VALSVAL